MDECVLCHKNFEGVDGLKYPVCEWCALIAAGAHRRAETKRLVADGWFRWTAEIAVREVWVADGFNLTENRLNSIMCRELGYANGATEIKTAVASSPDQKSIRVAQGYVEEK